MSIVHHLPKLPTEGATVYADNGSLPSDRAVFTGGKFMGGGEFPVREYEMTHVSKWFYLDEYNEAHRDQGSYCISFDIAERL